MVEGGGKYRVTVRPFAKEVLRRLKTKYEIGLFTASQPAYANAVLKLVDPENQIFDFRLYRQHCHQLNSGECVKDLRSLRDRDLKRVVLIDNTADSYLYQKNNAIPITSFYGDENDCELLKVEKFLGGIKNVKDVRQYLAECFSLDKYSDYETIADIVQALY